MKRLAFLFLFLPILSMAQDPSTYVFYSDGANFRVLFNGITQNDEPAQKVVISNVTPDAFKLRSNFIFEDENLGEVKTMISFQSNTQVTYYLERKGNSISVKKMEAGEGAPEHGHTVYVEYKASFGEDAPVDDRPIETEVVLRISGSGEIEQVNSDQGSTQGSGDRVPSLDTQGIDYEGPTGCEEPNDGTVLQTLLDNLDKADSDETRNKQLPSWINGKCFTVDQIQLVLKKFKTEQDKFIAATRMYSVMWDRGNVGELKGLFDQPESWINYMEFINHYQE